MSLVCLEMGEERDLAGNSRQHRLELIILYPQVRDEIQTGTYNPNMQFGWNRGS